MLTYVTVCKASDLLFFDNCAVHDSFSYELKTVFTQQISAIFNVISFTYFCPDSWPGLFNFQYGRQTFKKLVCPTQILQLLSLLIKQGWDNFQLRKAERQL